MFFQSKEDWLHMAEIQGEQVDSVVENGDVALKGDSDQDSIHLIVQRNTCFPGYVACHLRIKYCKKN